MPKTTIYQMNDEFDFKKINLLSPMNISTGNHFIQILLNDETPLYIQLPKCHIKQGSIKSTGKKSSVSVDVKRYCDLIFLNNNEQFVRWIENLEIYFQEIIFNNRENWFESNLEKEDIENSMSSMLKSYKGKHYTLRTNISSYIKIFDENETELDSDSFFSSECDFEKNLTCIIEIKGIKCSSRNFQIELEMKQMMIFNENDIFKKCLLGAATATATATADAQKNEKIIFHGDNTKPENDDEVDENPFSGRTDSSPSMAIPNPPSNKKIAGVLSEGDEPIFRNETEENELNIKKEIHTKHLAMSTFFNKKNIKNLDMLFSEENLE